MSSSRPAYPFALPRAFWRTRAGKLCVAGRTAAALLAGWFLIAVSAVAVHHHREMPVGAASVFVPPSVFAPDGTPPGARIAAPDCPLCDWEAMPAFVPPTPVPDALPPMHAAPPVTASALRARLTSLPAPRRIPRAPPAV